MSSERLRTAYVDVPDTLVYVIRTSSGSELRGITSNYLVPSVCFQIPYASGEETSSDEIEEAGRDNQKDLEPGRGTTP
jgi:hypothetical protein